METMDLREIIIAKLWADHYNEIYYKNEKAKQHLRNHGAVKFADYASISYGKQPFTHYEKDGKEIEIDTKEIIKKYCEENRIKIITETKEDYKVILKPSGKAVKEFDKMLNELAQSQFKNIAKIANGVKNKTNLVK